MRIYFKEEQKYRQAWLWFIIIPMVAGSILFFLSGINQQIIQGKSFGENPMSDAGLILISISSIFIMLVVAALFYYTKMILTITSEGISLRYPPLINKEVFYKMNEISRYEVRVYKPIKEFGGWGVKTASKKQGKAYNVRGNVGLQIFLTNGDKVMFGTQRKRVIADAMKKMMEAASEQKK